MQRTGVTAKIANYKTSPASNLILAAFILTLSLIGVLLLYSAAGGSFKPWASKQLTVAVAIIPVMLIIAMIDIRVIYKHSYMLYTLSILLLILGDIIGHKAMGAQRWIKLGGFNLQPSEVTKITMILALAKYLHTIHFSEIEKSPSLLIPALIVCVPTILLLRQPNLGTAILIVMTSATMLFISGVQIRKFVALLLIALAILPVAWNGMHDYQKKRVMTFLNPEQDPLGAGYNIMQSKVAIGSGGMSGKGFLNGTQSQLNFLPEKHTDFVFTLFAEEFGFGYSCLLILFYVLVIGYCYVIAMRSVNQYARLIAVGMGTLFFLHVFINIGMVSGILPVVGIPLPFLSFGGSNLLATLLGFGLVMNANTYSKVKLKRFL